MLLTALVRRCIILELESLFVVGVSSLSSCERGNGNSSDNEVGGEAGEGQMDIPQRDSNYNLKEEREKEKEGYYLENSFKESTVASTTSNFGARS